MKKILIAFMMCFAFSFCVADEYLTSDSVNEKDTGDFLSSGAVDAKATNTPVPPPPTPEPEDTPVPTPVPTKPAPKPTAKPTPKPTPRPVVKPTAVPTPVPTVARQVFTPQMNITKAEINELARNRTPENLFGLLVTDRKFTLNIELENSGNGSAYYTSAKLLTGDTSILVHEPEKTLQTVLPASRREMIFSLVVLADYEGDLKLPLKLSVKYSGVEKEIPVEAYIDESSPLMLYAAGGLLLLIIIILIALIAGRKEKPSKKNYDFNN